MGFEVRVTVDDVGGGKWKLGGQTLHVGRGTSWAHARLAPPSSLCRDEERTVVSERG